MNVGQAVGSAVRNYWNFSGRARRSEYWRFMLLYLVVSCAAEYLDSTLHTTALELAVAITLLLPALAVSVRRLHDIDRSGWRILVGMIPIVGFFWWLGYMCRDSKIGPNRYGDSPKYAPAYPLPADSGSLTP